MILSWNSGFSQDTTITLQSKIAKSVINDIITGDQAKEELFLTKDQITLLEEKIILKDGLIQKKDEIIFNYEEIIGSRNEQIKLSKDLQTKLKTDLKKQKAKTKLFQLGGGGLMLGVLILSIL